MEFCSYLPYSKPALHELGTLKRSPESHMEVSNNSGAVIYTPNSQMVFMIIPTLKPGLYQPNAPLKEPQKSTAILE